jgi:hypothetical protein
LHANFLSIPPVRYTGKAGEAPSARLAHARNETETKT